MTEDPRREERPQFPDEDQDRLRRLTDLRDDQRRRWLAGDRLPAERYLEQTPPLAADPEAVIDLIYSEFLLREQLGERPETEEYLRRFPHLADALRRQFDLHFALRSASDTSHGGESDVEHADDDPPTVVVGPGPGAATEADVPGYAILGELGRGGMGVVYKARQLSLKRLVALKMLTGGGQAGPEQLARFRREAEVVAGLRHPHIVQVYEVGEHAGRPYLAMEYVEGGSLAQQLAGTTLPPRRAAEVVETLARAMHAAHQHGVVHRDLKPSNVLLARDGVPTIADFGLAKYFQGEAAQAPEHATQSGAILGTPGYMAPEQARGDRRAVGPPADVYALGAILYETLTGRPPFKGAGLWETLEQVLTQEPVPPARLQPAVPRDLNTICLECLRKEPGRRYASAQALADDLRRFLQGEPIRARPAGPWERLRKWALRRPAAAALAVVSTAAILLLVLLGAWSNVALREAAERERRKADEAETQKTRAEAEKAEADTQRRQALANLDQVKDAVDHYYTEVSGSEELKGPGLQPLRKGLLRAALPYYEYLVRQKAQDPGARADLGAALLRLGDIVRDLDGRAKAREHYEQALAVFTDLAREQPDNPGYEIRRAFCLDHLGLVYRDLGEPERAEGALRQSVAIRSRLAGAEPAKAEYLDALARATNNLANIYVHTMRFDRAEETYREILPLYAKLTAEHPKAADYQQGQASVHGSLARLYLRTRRYPQAREAYQKALALLEPLADANPKRGDYRLMVVQATNGLGSLEIMLRQPARAAAAYEKAVAAGEKLVRLNPTVLQYRYELAFGYSGLGQAYNEGRRRDKADEALQKALALQERLTEDDPNSLPYAVDLGQTCHRIGQLKTDQGNPAEALPWLDRSVRVLELVRQKDAQNDALREALWWAHFRRMAALDKLKRFAEALADIDRALEFANAARRDATRTARALMLVRLGRHGPAAAAIQEVAQQTDVPAARHYQLAGLLAQCKAAALQDSALASAEREKLSAEYAAAAIQLLNKARAAGYFEDPARVEALKKETDFEPLRDHPEYVRFLRQLEPTRPER